MMNDRARLWSKRKSAPFADPRDEERALREMRKSIDHSFNFNIDFKGEQPYMDNYRATVSFGAGCWQNTGTRRHQRQPDTGQGAGADHQGGLAGGGAVRRAGCYLRPAGGCAEHHDHHGRGAADAHAVIESAIHSNKPQKRESGGRTCIRNCWYASESG